MIGILKNYNKIPLAFGGASISGEGGGYGFGTISESDSISLLKCAFDNGIRVFDTAPVYGFSTSEKRLGKAFYKNREEVFISSKCGVTWHDNGRINLTNEPKVAIKMLEQTLRDLKSDYVDLYMIHWPDKSHDIRKTMEVLSIAKDQGKIKHIGLCNTNIADLDKSCEVDTVEVVQSEFNLFNNSLKETLFPYLKENKISFMSYGTFDKGILTGRVDEKRVFEKVDCRSWAPWWKKSNLLEKFEKYKKLEPIFDKYNTTGIKLALAFNFLDDVVMPICGFRSIFQLESALIALEDLPNKEIIEEALKVIDE